MKKGLFYLSCFSFFASTLTAALPPLFQDIAELKEILNDRQLGQLLQSGETINQITRTEKGYVITTNQSSLTVEVVYAPSKRPGPVAFSLKFIKPKPKNF